jgi:hypothetical protein
MKNWQTRLTQTWAFIDAGGFPLPQVNALKAYHNGLTAAERQAISVAMAQGGYNAGVVKALEKNNRNWRRALILALMARKNSGVPANDLLAAQNALAANIANDEAERRVKSELKDLANAVLQVRMMAPTNINWGGWDGATQRPLLPGCNIGRRGANGPGTLGCFVTNAAGHIFILSNRHVLRQNGSTDDEIIQPAHQLGGSFFDDVATFTAELTTHDAAIARVKTGVVCNNVTPEGVAITGSNAAVLGAVTKRGCASRARRGIVTNVASPNVNALGHILQDQLLIDIDLLLDPQAALTFQIQGDSGSVVLNGANEVVALMHGQNGATGGQATHIAPILAHFNVLVLVGQLVAP